MRITYSLKDALTWRFIIVAVLPLLIVSVISFDYFSRETEQRLQRENFSHAEVFASYVALELHEPYLLIQSIPKLIDHAELVPDSYSDLLDRLVAGNSNFLSLFILDNNRDLIAAGVSERGAADPIALLDAGVYGLLGAQKDRPFRGVIWSQVLTSDFTTEASLAVAYQAKNYWLIGNFSIEQLRHQLTKMVSDGASHLALLDENGKTLLQIPPPKSRQLVSFEEMAPVQAVLEHRLQTSRYEYAGNSYIGTAVPIPNMKWYVLYGQGDATLTDAISRLRMVFFFGCLAAIFFASLLSRALAKKIVRPIAELITSTQSFSDGDYRHPLPYGNHRELDELSDGFRRMRLAIDEREQQLWKNREYFQRLFNGIADAIFISTRLPNGNPGKFSEVNSVACRLLGYSREELLTLSPYDTNQVSHDSPEDFEQIIEQITDSGSALFKSHLRCKNGDLIPVEIGSQLFELGGKRVFFSVARDITMREKYESSIQTLVRSTVGLTGQACLDEITRNLCHWLGADGASISLFRSDYLLVQSCCIDERLSSRFSMPVAATPYVEIRDNNYIHLTENVDVAYPAIQGAGLTEISSFIGIPMLGHEGQVIGAVSVFSRKTLQVVPHTEELLSVIASRASTECERMHYERELSHSEEMLRTLFNSTAEAIVGIDLQGDCIFCNPATLRILGYDDEKDLIGKRFYRLVQYFPTDFQPSTQDSCPFMVKIQQEQKIVAEDASLAHRDGHGIPVEFWGHPMSEEGELVGGVVTFIDISRRRILEKQLQQSQRMEAIGTLAGGIAHDFNNILTVITGYAGLLQAECKDDQRLLPKANKIAEAADRGSKLTHGLLAYSRKKTEPSTPVDLNQLVIKVYDLFGKVIGEWIEKQMTLSTTQLIVLGDTSQLEQVLVNLATNARDAMPDGGVLRINTTQTVIDRDFCRVYGYGEPGDYALITVEDTGCGMSKDIQQKIFDPFYTTKDTGKGTGLGLAIAWGVVKQHKGYILVDSEPGQGTRFRIYLPLTEQKLVPQRLIQLGELPGGDETILLVEDDPQVRESTCSILSAVGYQVINSDCADSALKILELKEHEIALILSDVVMPGMKGTEFYKEIRTKTAVPVIFISGYTFDTLREQGLVGEDFMLLNKPIQPIYLLTKIRETLNREQAIS